MQGPIPITISLVKNKVDIWWLADGVGPVKVSSPQYEQLGSVVKGEERQMTQKKIVTTAVESQSFAPSGFALGQNYPNPFNPTTTIPLTLNQTAFVNIKVYSLLGQEIATLVNGRKDAGRYAIAFDASRLPSGVYFYKLTATGPGTYFTETKRMMLVR
jgi:hypothetical protein